MPKHSTETCPEVNKSLVNKKKLKNVVQKSSICERYFLEMFNNESIHFAKQFLEEEKATIATVLISNSYPKDRTNFVGVGVGPLLYSELATQYCDKYIAIDPLIEKHCLNTDINRDIKVSVMPNDYLHVNLSKKQDRRHIFAFVFNVLSYFDNPLEALNHNLQDNDIIIISTWSKKQSSKLVRDKYFRYLDKISGYTLPAKKSYLTDLETLPIQKLKFFKNKHLVYGDVCDTMIVYT